MGSGQPVEGSLFIYAPNKVAPVVFACLFATSAVGHIWQCCRYKSWKMVGLHPLCAVLFSLGYALREYGAFNYDYDSTANLVAYIMTQVFIYIAPPLLELANYHILGRIFHYCPYFSPIPANRVLSTFAFVMIIVETLNALGVSLSANAGASQGTQKLGNNLTLAALALQLCIVIIFYILAGLFHRRCAKSKITPRSVMTPLIILYLSMALILIRCIYRLVEHLGNTKVDYADFESLQTLSPILRYEVYFYIFESSLMFINSMLWNIWNPGRFLPRNYHVYLSKDGSSEIEGKVKTPARFWLSMVSFGVLGREVIEQRPFVELVNQHEMERMNSRVSN